MADVWSMLKPRLAAFDAFLREAVRLRLSDVPLVLAESLEYSLFAGGKRLRPMLCGLACEAAGGRFEDAFPAGVALELIHTYSLIHDDLPDMDDDDLRRGRPTCHMVFGNALAILAGDALQPMAFEVLASSYAPAVAAAMTRDLAAGCGPAGMVGGQVLDLIEDGRVNGEKNGTPVERLEAVHRRKTGALFRASLSLGASAAIRPDNPLTPSAKAWLDDYAMSFGLLFQITDDLLDATGTEAATGKRTGKDAAKGKLTYPGLIGIAASRETAEQLANQCVAAAGRFGERGKCLGDLARSMVERST